MVLCSAHRWAQYQTYSGHPIPCRDSINIQLSKSNEQYQSHKFYVVNVPGPAILDQPSCEQLNVLTLDHDTTTTGCSDQIDELSTTRLTYTTKYAKCADVKWCFPECFDTIGEINWEAKPHLKSNNLILHPT